MIRRLFAAVQPKPLGRHNARRVVPPSAEVLAQPVLTLTREQRLALTGCESCQGGVAYGQYCIGCGRGSYTSV